MVFIPIYFDQPMVAKRIADQLGLGIRLETETLTYEKIRNAAHTILNDKSYLIRIKRFSDISRSYDGVENIKSEIIEIIQKKKV